ncbi:MULTISPECIES: hypothetical protein [unclassified Paenibacillus]|nr:hypothetical protein [Paenibacillus sp. 7541]
MLAFLSTVAFARYIERGAVFKMKVIVILTISAHDCCWEFCLCSSQPQ